MSERPAASWPGGRTIPAPILWLPATNAWKRGRGPARFYGLSNHIRSLRQGVWGHFFSESFTTDLNGKRAPWAESTMTGIPGHELPADSFQRQVFAIITRVVTSTPARSSSSSDSQDFSFTDLTIGKRGRTSCLIKTASRPRSDNCWPQTNDCPCL